VGQETFTFVRFSTISRLNGEYLLKEMLYRQSGKGVGKYEGFSALSQNFMNFGYERLKSRSEFLTHPHCFVPSQSIAHPLSGINVAPHSDSNWVCLQHIFEAPKDVKLGILSRRAVLSGNTSL